MSDDEMDGTGPRGKGKVSVESRFLALPLLDRCTVSKYFSGISVVQPVSVSRRATVIAVAAEWKEW